MKQLVLLSFLLLTACVNTQLHLVTKGYSKSEVATLKTSLSEHLENQKIDVVLSEIVIPANFPNATLALNPTYNQPEIIARLDNWLVANGHKTSQEFRFSEGNHYYSKAHLGLYLRKPGTERQVDLPPYLRTQYCDVADGTLALNKDGQAVLEYELIGDGGDKIDTLSGQWFFADNHLTVDFKNLRQTFKLAKEEKQTHLGPRPADVYNPTKQLAQKHILNCEFLIIYMN
ncbi:hypothetical protein AAEU29_16915 [Pseudoalteromonas sp. SSM20]|uniref:hypothetical protein n=1 Tax=Pseudoalteromonas sp. SSM20 TaxID=3139394 RepID=UPI003BAA69D8